MNMNFIGQAGTDLKSLDSLKHPPKFAWACNRGGLAKWDLYDFAFRVQWLRSRFPGIQIGQYCSACTAKGNDDFPPTGLPLTVCMRDWFFYRSDQKFITWPGYPQRPFLNITLDKVQDCMIDWYLAWDRVLGLDFFAVDNGYCDILPVDDIPLAAKAFTDRIIWFLRRLRSACGKPVVVNVTAGNAAKIPLIFQRFASVVDGFCIEDSLHPNIRANPDLLKKELDTYRLYSRSRLVLTIPARANEESECLKLLTPIAKENNIAGDNYRGIYCTAAGPAHENPLHEVKTQ